MLRKDNPCFERLLWLSAVPIGLLVAAVDLRLDLISESAQSFSAMQTVMVDDFMTMAAVFSFESYLVDSLLLIFFA